MKRKLLILFSCSILFYFLFSFHKYILLIEDKHGENKYVYFGPVKSILDDKFIKIKGFVTSDSVILNENVLLSKFETEKRIVLHKGKIDTSLGLEDYYDDKYQIEYIPFPQNKDCNNHLRITIRIL